MTKTVSKESAFIRHLRRRSEPADLARLRRTLSAPGQEVVPVVERFLARIQREREDAWERVCHYLVAGLWAITVSSSQLEQFREQPEEAPEVMEDAESPVDNRYRRTFGHAVAQLYLARNEPKSIEQRFITLLDADEEQLPYRMRQMVQLVKSEEGIRIHWADLLRDLLRWNHERKYVQQRWASAFYRTVSTAESQDETQDETQDEGENA